MPESVPSPAGSPPRVFAIGLDGATFDLLLPWFAEGKLPTLARLYAQGAHGPLTSVIPYLSPQAWTSFLTGKNPGKHGVWDFLVHRPHSYDIQFTNARHRRAASLWQILSAAGKSVCVVNVPMTFPPEPVNGYLISGMEAPGVYANFAYPPGLYARLKKALGGYNMHGDYWITGTPEEYLERVHDTIADQSRAVRFLLEDRPWDFFMMVFGSTDRVQHHFWAQMDATHPRHDPAAPLAQRTAIYDVYEHLDRELATFLAMLPPETTLLVMSDHGAGPYDKIVYLDRWLESQGLLRYRVPPKRGHRLSPRRLLLDTTEEVYLRLRGTLPRSVKDWLKSNMPTARRVLESYLLTSAIDWRRTAAFSLGIESTRIFVNTARRFPHGFVEPGAPYDAVIEQITRGLSALTDPDTGEPVVAQISRRHDLYSGPFIDEAADLVVRWRDDRYITRHTYGPETGIPTEGFIDDNLAVGEVGRLMSIPQTGTHRLHGILTLTGPAIAVGRELESCSILDLTPTILHLLGQPVPEDMDGRVLTEALSPDFTRRRGPVQMGGAMTWNEPAEFITKSEEEEEAIIRERLRGLGYIE